MAVHTSGTKGIRATAELRATRWQALKPDRPRERRDVLHSARLPRRTMLPEAHPAGAARRARPVADRASPADDGGGEGGGDPPPPVALVFLDTGDTFAAWRIGRDRHLVTAFGRFRHRVGLRHERRYRFTGWTTRSWPTRRIREIHWASPADAEAVA